MNNEKQIIPSVKTIILKDNSEMVAIINGNDIEPDTRILQIKLTEDGNELNISYGNRWLVLKDGEITEKKFLSKTETEIK